MKKVFKAPLVLSASLALLLTACNSGSAPSNKEEGNASVSNSITIDTQIFSEGFISGFGNSFDEAQIKSLMSNNTVELDANGKWHVNNNLLEKDIEREDLGEAVRFTVHLKKDLKWSDGEPMTAHDFLASNYLYFHPGAAAQGIEFSDSGMNKAVYPFHEGKTEVLGGYKIIDDYTFSQDIEKEVKVLRQDDEGNEITSTKVNFPNYYEIIYLGFSPLPLHAISAEGTKFENKDDGIVLVGDDPAVMMEKYVKNFRYKVTVSSGPFYMDEKSDPNSEIILKANKYYAGNYEGQKPQLDEVILKPNDQIELRLDRLISGEVDYTSHALDKAEFVEKARAHDDVIGLKKYSRNGYGYVVMPAANNKTTSDVNVRLAVAKMIDRNSLIQSIFKGNAEIVNADYSMAQWMYQEKKAELEKELNPYTFNLDEANALLDKTQFRFEADGKTPYDSSKASAEYLRHNDKGEVFLFRHMSTENNPISTNLLSQFTENAPKVGMKYEITTVAWNKFVEFFYNYMSQDESSRYDLFNLALGFADIYDPMLSGYSTLNLNTTSNPFNFSSEEFDKLASSITLTEPGNNEAYLENWLKFQVYRNKMVLNVPLYANTYYAAFRKDKIDEESFIETPFANYGKTLVYFKAKK